MKNILIALIFILFVAVSALFYLHFASLPGKTHAVDGNNSNHQNTETRFAYFDLDSLENEYEYFKEVRAALRSREEQMAGELNSIRNQYLSQLKEYNQNGPNLSQSQQSAYQQKLMKLQAEYQQREQDLNQNLQSESLKQMQDVRQTIQAYLKDYSKKKNLSFVFAANENDFIYYKDASLNITKELISDLNEEHKAKKKQSKK